MANQYSGSLEHKARQKYDCSAKELLKHFSEEDLSYLDAQDRLGVTHGTIRKWARRFGIELRSGEIEQKDDDRLRQFYAPELNSFNFLSRKW